ncbi:polysaccharide lyase family protein [Kutzneria sp. CA-103260]|uniref:polysaccharide lyase family protein n=1 Tax=Kutzneria sp. CA-103260 TaxID=2802641 RepID=UPI001BA4AA41|nr:polysaccharide lyase family protein [Kutzneria sp. CA-103260]
MSSHPTLRRRWLVDAVVVLVAAASVSTVVAGSSAGAPAYTEPSVFTIGSPDQSDAEFALSPGDYQKYPSAFPQDATYTVGLSRTRDWPYIQPGPADAWAGGKSHADTINYSLAAVPATDLILRIDYVDTHDSAPPTVEVLSNGHSVESVTTPAGGGAGVYGIGSFSGTTGYVNRPHEIGVLIPRDTLAAGRNSLVLRSTAGSWAAYDSVRLVPAPGQLGAVRVLAETPTVLFKSDQRQLVDVDVQNTAGPAAATITATLGRDSARTTIASLPAGRSTQRIEVPAAPGPGPSKLDITVALDGQPAGTYATSLPYQRRWQVDIINGSHLDIGYHYDQATTRQLQDAFLDQAVAQCAATANRPDAERYRWTVEQAWMIDDYVQDRPADKVKALGGCVAAGQIELTASYDNNLSDLGSTEQLIRAQDKGTRTFAAKFGRPVTAAMQDDVTGVTAQKTQLLAKQGVTMLINGSNPDHTGRWSVPHTAQDFPALYHLQAPDGSSVLTFLAANSYDEGYKLNWQGLKCGLAPWPSDDPNDTCGTAPTLPYHPVAAPSPAQVRDVTAKTAAGIANWFPGLQAGRYPQSVYPLMFFEDSTPPMNGISDVIHTFGQQYAWPKLVMSTPSRFYQDATTAPGQKAKSGYSPDPTSRDASQLPVKSGDYPDWWSDGAGSSAFETGENMQAQVRTGSAETLGALAPSANQQCLVDSAYREEELYTEHTWASPELIPDDPQWAVKKAHADKASRLSTDAMDAATAALGGQVANPSANPGIAVFNSVSTRRSDVVTTTVPDGWSGQLVDAQTGAVTPYEPAGPGKIRFIAADVPAVGYRTYELRSGANPTVGLDSALHWDSGQGILENQYYRVTVSTDTGVVKSVYDKAAGRELVDTTSAFGLNQYVYRPNPQRDGRTTPDKQWSPGRATVTVQSAGPVSVSIKVAYPDTPGGKDGTGAATGVESAGATFTLYANTKRLDIADDIDKTWVTTPEEGYFAFPFKVDKPTVTYEAPGTPVTLGAGQLPGSSMDWQAVRGYADLSNAGGGVTMSTTDTPLMEFGHIRSMELQPRPGRLDQSGPDPAAPTPDNGSAFSYAFNSLWNTNYRQAQSGPVSFHYSITSHDKGFEPVAATGYGMGVQTPLASAPLSPSHAGTYPGGAKSLVSVDAANVFVQAVKQAYPVRQASSLTLPLTVRLLEVAGKSGTVRLRLPYKVTAAQLESPSEQPNGPKLAVVDSGSGSEVIVPVGQHEIVTVGVRPATPQTAATPLVCASDFALAPDGYQNYAKAFPHDVDYTAQQDPGFTAGVSYPSATTPWVSTQGGSVVSPRWSYIQPGPSDDWAGSRPHTFTLRFTVAEPRDLTLSLWLLDSRSPAIDVALNGQAGKRIQLPSGGSSQTIALHGLKAGQNSVTITTTAGSWLAYDGFAIGG